MKLKTLITWKKDEGSCSSGLHRLPVGRYDGHLVAGDGHWEGAVQRDGVHHAESVLLTLGHWNSVNMMIHLVAYEKIYIRRKP